MTHPDYVIDVELKDMINSNVANIRIATTARSLFWCYLNGPFREVYRSFRKKHKGKVGADGNSLTYPDYFPTDAQIYNMKQLVLLQEASQVPNRLGKV